MVKCVKRINYFQYLTDSTNISDNILWSNVISENTNDIVIDESIFARNRGVIYCKKCTKELVHICEEDIMLKIINPVINVVKVFSIFKKIKGCKIRKDISFRKYRSGKFNVSSIKKIFNQEG